MVPLPVYARAALLIPEESPPEREEPSAARLSPADFVPPSDALRAWREIADDAAARVGQQALQTYGALRLGDALEVSGVRVRTFLHVHAWPRPTC